MAQWMKALAFKRVQFQWTERHLQQGSLCTVVSARYSGGSYLNKVELQNGCLALGHSNVFIPSTNHGSNQGDDGLLCKEKLKKHLDAVAEVYITTISGSPCFGTKIHLIKGATDEVSKLYCDRRSKLLTFQRGSKKAKKKLYKNCTRMITNIFYKYGNYVRDMWSQDYQQIIFSCLNHVTYQNVHTLNALIENLL